MYTRKESRNLVPLTLAYPSRKRIQTTIPIIRRLGIPEGKIAPVRNTKGTAQKYNIAAASLYRILSFILISTVPQMLV
jgi:hypothetical protein